ncbi:hypothetical protein OF83DRAFT_1128488 [Amylostereum chailletii]|nr:hypothetical protein OF83DRAFT_1128488 [Amylostereum chailletii]
MKRTRDDASSNGPSPDGSVSAAGRKGPAKRPKSSQACASCRKHKTRCELLDSSSYVSRCHRCEVLSISCSFETEAPRSSYPDPTPLPGHRQKTASVLLVGFRRPHSSEYTLDHPPDADAEDGKSPWDFLQIPGMPDWTATPVLAMRTLSRQVCQDPFPKYDGRILTLQEILSLEQRQWLLNFFDLHYEPWLSLPSNTLVNDDVLDLVRCTIASRHLEPLSRTQVLPALHKLTDEVIMQHVFNPNPSIAAVQAFAMLSLWSPFENLPSTTTGSRDSRLIAASAISMGTSLHLDKGCVDAISIHKRMLSGEKISFQEATKFTTSSNDHFLWACLHVVESMACLGTGRSVSSKTTDIEFSCLESLTDTLDSARRARLLLMNRLYDLAECGLRLEMTNVPDHFDSFYEDVTELLFRFDGTHRLVAALPVTSDWDVFYLHMLSVHSFFCRLTFLVHILRLLRRHVPPAIGSGGFFAAKIKKTGCAHALRCARDALTTSEAILTTILSVQEKELLATCPDAIFSMISFAASYMTMAKFMLLQSQGQRHIPGCGDQLIARVITCLNRISPSPDHHASRCAMVISNFVDTFLDKLAIFDAEQANKLGGKPVHTPMDRESDPSPFPPHHTSPTMGTTSESTLSSSATLNGTPELPHGAEFNFPSSLAPDELFGMEFWQYFADLPLPEIYPQH